LRANNGQQGQSLGKASREHRQIYPKAGWVEHDAEEIWQNLVAVVSQLKREFTDACNNLAALSISNQRETVVVFEKHSGKPLHNAIVWQCRRSEAICNEFVANGHDQLVHNSTGLKIDPYFSASKLYWLMENRPEIKQKLIDGSALIGTIDCYLIYRLTKGKVFATDSTNASRTLLCNINELRWDEKLCQLWQVPMQALPQVKESSASFGETDLDGLLSKPIPISGVMGDSQAALFALRSFQPGACKVTFGTGSSVLLNIGEQAIFSQKGLMTTLAWQLQGKATYAFEGIIINSASSLNWLITQLTVADNLDSLLSLIDSVEHSHGVYLVPAFSGMGFPYWQSDARAAIVGLSSHSDRRHIARAALESMAYQLKDVLIAMQNESDIALKSLRADGGPSANKKLMQFTADMIQNQLNVCQLPDCSPLGSALMAMLGLGILKSIDDIDNLNFEETRYNAKMNAENVDKFYQGWDIAVKQVLRGATA